MKITDKSFKYPGQIISSIKAAKQEFARHNRYIEKNFSNTFSLEISILQERNYQLLSAIAKNEQCMF